MRAFQNPDGANEILVHEVVLRSLLLCITKNFNGDFGSASRYIFCTRSDHFGLMVLTVVTIMSFDGLANQGIAAGR